MSIMLAKEYKEQLQRGAEAMGIALNEEQQEKLLDFGDLLLLANEKTNLTAITDPKEVVSRHFLDSLAPLGMPEARPYLLGTEIRGIDVGTGAGLPGIPLAIALPDTRITLLDAQQKRIRFLQETAEKLELDNISILEGRAEEWAHTPAHREQYDFATARAVAKLATLAEYDLPFVRKNGAMLAYKGAEPGEEMADAVGALERLGGGEAAEKPYVLPGTDSRHTLLIIKKEQSTPEKYPRRAGIPTKRPL